MDDTRYTLKCNAHGKVCEFSCDNDTPIPLAKEALCQFIKHICNHEEIQRLEAEAKAELEKKEEAEKEPKKGKKKNVSTSSKI